MTADLPDLYTSAHLYFGGAPRLTYTESHFARGIRIDAASAGAFIAVTSPEEAARLATDLEFVARELRRRLGLPASSEPSAA